MYGRISDVYELKRDEFGSLKKAEGLWRGVCEYNIDPKGLGRIKVRVPTIHGAAIGGADYLGSSKEQSKSGTGIDTDSLPWAWPCFKTGGIADTGDFDVPLIGASVWIMFEQADPKYPVWMGTWPYIPEKSQEVNTISSWNIPDPSLNVSMGTWMQAAGLTIPKEAQADFNDTFVRVVAKSPKGATILAKDTDEAEVLMIIDRLGQVLEMYTPVNRINNAGNAAQRGTRSARNQNDASQSAFDPGTYCKDGKAYIRIIDASYKNGTPSGQFIKLSAERDKQLVRIHGASGHDVYIDSTSGDEKIVIKDNKGNFICFDKDSNIRIKAKKDQKVSISGDSVIDIEGNYTLKVGGTLEIDCKTLVIKSESATLNGQNAITLTSGGLLNVSAASNVSINAGGAILEAAAAHTTTAGAIAHTPGAGAPQTPESPSKPGDAAGSIDLPPEQFPIG